MIALVAALTSCGLIKKSNSNESSGSYSSGSGNSYYKEYSDLLKRYNELKDSTNALKEKYNTLLDSGYGLDYTSQQEVKLLLDLDKKLEEFSEGTNEFFKGVLVKDSIVASDRPTTDGYFATVEKRQNEVLAIVERLELNLLFEMTALDKNSTHVYENPETQQAKIQELRDAFSAKGSKLAGFKSLVLSHVEHLRIRYAAIIKASNLPAAPVARPVVLRAEEKPAAAVPPSQGFVKDNGGKIEILKDEAAVTQYARQNGFDGSAASAGYKMSSATGGLVTFAADEKKFTQAAIDVFSHVKTKMSTNADGLEVVFVLDYSGSMQNKIKGTIDGLVAIVKSLENIKDRGYKVGIVTFGKPGKELLNLQPTENLTKVVETLQNLLTEYPDKTHSTDPGEASYHGLKKVADEVNWKSKNRMAIVITDEPAWELEPYARLESEAGAKGHGQKFVDGIFESLKKDKVQTSIYTIIAGRY